ncbi:MAG: hypothetical protein H9W81_10160 [Enterococcus sp.]|nr:hypothetical protein [Enterococcus sp.]
MLDFLMAGLDFDPNSFIIGAATIGGAWFASGKGRQFINHKRNILDSEILNEFKTQCELTYAELAKRFKALDDKYLSAKSSFQLAFPKSGNRGMEAAPHSRDRFYKSHDDYAEGLADMLVILNKLKNEHVSRSEFDNLVRQWEANKNFVKNADYSLPNLINHYLSNTSSMKTRITNGQRAGEVLGERLEEAQRKISHIEKNFDPLFWDKVPAALKKATDSYNLAMEDINTLDIDFYRFPVTIDSRLNNAETLIKRLENMLEKIVNYNPVAMRKAAKVRKELNTLWGFRYGGRKTIPAEHKNMMEEARLSLLKAETQEYSGGNPEKVFEATIKPCRVLSEVLRKK